MKKLLKSEVCGIVNSARVHCSLLKSQQYAAEPKKKKKTENALNPETWTCRVSKPTLEVNWVILFIS